MCTGSLWAATQADPGQRATPQKSRLTRKGEMPYRDRHAGQSGAIVHARKSAGAAEKSPPCGLMHKTFFYCALYYSKSSITLRYQMSAP